MGYTIRVQETALRQFLAGHGGDQTVLLVEGARQVGKTTLIEQCLQGTGMPVVALNLERQKRIRGRIDGCAEFQDFGLVLRDECGFDPARPGVLFIDEAQESERLGGFVRFIREDWTQTRTVLTGSTLTRLFRKEQRFPVGRVTRLLVTPFSFSEFLRTVGKEFLCGGLEQPERISATEHESLCRELDRYLLVGGMPAVVSALVDEKDWGLVRRDILADYDDDLKRIFGEEAMDVVRGCLRAAASLAGSAFKNTTVIPSPTTARNEQINAVLARLEDWKMVLKSEQHGLDPIQSYHYHPKRYLFDTGLMGEMREPAVPSLQLLQSTDPAVRTALGGVIENQAAVDLSRAGDTLAGWKRSSAGSEIDFVLKAGGQTVPVECKAALQIKGTHLDGLKGYLRTYGMRMGVTLSLARYQRIDCGEGMTILNVPLYCAGHLRQLFPAD